MRNREEIKHDTGLDNGENWEITRNQILILETLLDIRELLINNKE